MGDEAALRPRECAIRKQADFQGYGFNLHAERQKAGQYIGKVDDNSPAQAAGLKESDRIVEVNGVNVGNENHAQVVERIRQYTDIVTLLVVDPETDAYFKEKKIVVKGDMSEVFRKDEASPRPEEPEEKPPSYSDIQDDEREAPSTPEPASEPEPAPRTPTPEPEPEPVRVPTPEPEPEPEPYIPVPEPEPEPVSPVPPSTCYPRLCIIIKWPDFQGYGFNLHAEKDKTGQYIGKIDENSPAEEADLREGDRIIEVNGRNIERMAHNEVIGEIKAVPDKTELLVVDRESDEFYKNNGITVHPGLPELKIKSATPRGVTVTTITSTPATDNSTSPTPPRECHIVKWPDFNGYGFNLHAEKNTGAQYIGKIDDASPAQDAELKEGDRIVGVNGVNVEHMTHQQVIEQIKAGGSETKLLVVDRAADAYYKSKGITVSTSLPEVQFRATTRRSASGPVSNGDGVPQSPPTRSEPEPYPSAPAPAAAPAPTPATANGGTDDVLNIKLSAKEMRERLQAKKKADAKSKGDFRKKYEIFQQL